MGDTRHIHVNEPSLMVRKGPDALEECVNQLLYGEEVIIVRNNGIWGLAQSVHDSYEGYVPLNALKFHQPKTHKVLVPRTHIYDAPNYKTDPRQILFFLSQVHVTGEIHNGFAKLYNGGWVFERHIMPINAQLQSPVDLAMMFLNAPYLWGGRSIDGIDCSGLIQMITMATGKPCPRDSTPQCKYFLKTGEKVTSGQHGDLVYFDGHVGIMIDEKHVLSATARHMRTVIEPLDKLEKAYNGIKAIVRV